MPFIEMSSSFASGISARILRLGETTTTQVNVAQAGMLSAASTLTNPSGSAGYLFLMRGTVPTSPPVNYGARSSDILVSFFSNAFGGGGHFLTTNQSINPCNISTQYVGAAVSGECTWFWLLTSGSVNLGAGSLPNNNTYQSIIGTVGLPGSGADLIIPNVNIVAGEQYRVLNLRLQFPTSWTY